MIASDRDWEIRVYNHDSRIDTSTQSNLAYTYVRGIISSWERERDSALFQDYQEAHDFVRRAAAYGAGVPPVDLELATRKLLSPIPPPELPPTKLKRSRGRERVPVRSRPGFRR